MAQTVNFSGPLKGSRRIGESTPLPNEMSNRNERCIHAPVVRRNNAKLEELLGISDTKTCVIKKKEQNRLRKKSSNNGLKTAKNPPLHTFEPFKFQDEDQHTRDSSPVFGRDDVAGSLPSSMSSSTYSLDKPTSRDFFDHLNGRHDYSNPSSPTSYDASSLRKGYPAVIRQAYNMDGLTIIQQEARRPPTSHDEPQKPLHLGLSRFIPKICRPKRSVTPKSELTSQHRKSPPHVRNGSDWRRITVKAQESEDEEQSPPRVLHLPRAAKPMKTTEEMQKWLDEAQIAEKPAQDGTLAVSSDPNSQLPSPTFSEPSSENSASTLSVQTLTSQKSTRISRRLKERVLPPEEPIPQSTAARAHEKCVAWNLTPNDRNSRDLQHESMLSISSSDDESRTSRDLSRTSKPTRHIVNFSKPRLSRTPSANQSAEVGSPNPWHWSGAVQPSATIDHTIRPPSARRKSIPNVIGQMESVAIDLAIDPLPRKHSPPRRFMAVTKHEEKLLEAMREKRASMRIESSTDGEAWSQQSESPRPKTSGGVVRSPTILHGTDVSSFPSPPKLSAKAFSRSPRLNTLRPEFRADLMNKSYLASVHSLESPLLVAAEDTALTKLTTRFEELSPEHKYSPASEISPLTPAIERFPIEVVTTRGLSVRANKGLGIDRASAISSRISLKSGERETVSAIEERERDGDTTSDEEEDLVIWAMEVSVH